MRPTFLKLSKDSALEKCLHGGTHGNKYFNDAIRERILLLHYQIWNLAYTML